jgi:DNA-binding HxlR family transcriptional regulator
VSNDELPECGVARFLILFDGPWATLIVRELLHGPHRFSELRDALPGISAHTLTSRLRRFETHGIVTRTAYAEIPPRVVYELTPLGSQLRPVLDAMNEWGMTALARPSHVERPDDLAVFRPDQRQDGEVAW